MQDPEKKEMEFDYIPVSQLDLWEDINVRKTDVYLNIEELADNIRKIGVQVPLLVKPKGNNKYWVISGQRRLIASKKAGLEKVPCVIRKDIKPLDARIASFSENIYRLDMNDDDKSEAAAILLEELKNEHAVAKRLGVSVQTVRSYLGYRTVPENIKEFVRQHKMNRDTATKIYKKFKHDPSFAYDVAKDYAEAPKSQKSAVNEAIDKTQPTDDLQKLKKNIQEAEQSTPYKIRLPSLTSDIINRLAKQGGTSPSDIIVQIIQKWVTLFKEGKVSL